MNDNLTSLPNSPEAEQGVLGVFLLTLIGIAMPFRSSNQAIFTIAKTKLFSKR